MSDQDDMLRAQERALSNDLALILLKAITTASIAQPDILRTALASVFDLKRTEELYEKMQQRIFLATQKLEALEERCRLAEEELGKLRKTVANAQEFLSHRNGKHAGPAPRIR